MYIPIISSIIDGVSNYVSHKQELKKIAKEGEIEEAKIVAQTKVKQAEANLAMAQEGQRIDGDLDKAAISDMRSSLKDEYLMLILTAPFVGSFIPTVQDHVAKGWEYIANAPEWYMYSFIGMMIATFGLRGLFKWVMQKKFSIGRQ